MKNVRSADQCIILNRPVFLKKPLTKQQIKDQEAAVRQEREGELEDLHRTLENEENRAFGKEGVEEVRRTKYESLSERDKKTLVPLLKGKSAQ